VGVGYKTGTLIGSMLNGEWAKLYRDSQLAIDRDGTIWHGAFHSEKTGAAGASSSLPQTRLRSKP
jgi:hypothetical protein